MVFFQISSLIECLGDPLTANIESLANSKGLAWNGLKVVKNKPDCIHSMGAVPKPDGVVRPITDCSMPKDIAVNKFCDNTMKEFKYNSVDNVLSMHQEGDYMAVVDIKSA